MSELILMAMLPAAVADEMSTAIQRPEIVGVSLFQSEYRHQSLSLKYPANDYHRERLLRAGSRVCVEVFELTLDRFGSGGQHWMMVASHESQGFKELTRAVETAMRKEGIRDTERPRAHVTVCYFPKFSIDMMEVPAVRWRIDEFMLIEKKEGTFGYKVIRRWSLKPAGTLPAAPTQMVLL